MYVVTPCHELDIFNKTLIFYYRHVYLFCYEKKTLCKIINTNISHLTYGDHYINKTLPWNTHTHVMVLVSRNELQCKSNCVLICMCLRRQPKNNVQYRKNDQLIGSLVITLKIKVTLTPFCRSPSANR